jgi:hypothetical protein
LQPAVIVAVDAVGVVQMAVHQVIDVIPVWHRLVAAIRSVNVLFIVRKALVAWRTFLGIRRVHLNVMVVHVVAVRVMQVTIVKIVRVAIVFYRRMATVRAVLVAVRP